MICNTIKKTCYKIVEKMCDNNKIFIIEICCEPPTLILKDLEKELQGKNIIGEVILDCLLYAGNTSERFIQLNFNGYEFEKNSMKFINIKRGDNLRKITSDFLRVEVEILDFSILTNIQKKLILNGLNI